MNPMVSAFTHYIPLESKTALGFLNFRKRNREKLEGEGVGEGDIDITLKH